MGWDAILYSKCMQSVVALIKGCPEPTVVGRRLPYPGGHARLYARVVVSRGVVPHLTWVLCLTCVAIDSAWTLEGAERRAHWLGQLEAHCCSQVSPQGSVTQCCCK